MLCAAIRLRAAQVSLTLLALHREREILQHKLSEIIGESQEQMEISCALRGMVRNETEASAHASAEASVSLRTHASAEAALQGLGTGGITIGQGPVNLPKLRVAPVEGKQVPAAFRGPLDKRQASG